WKRSASTRVVFPTPRWPATAMLRILAGSVAGIETSPPRSLRPASYPCSSAWSQPPALRLSRLQPFEPSPRPGGGVRRRLTPPRTSARARRGPARSRQQSHPNHTTQRQALRGDGRREVRLEPEDRLRVELGDARLGDAEHLADLAQGQLLVVVERHDELLALGQARDRVGDRLLLLCAGERSLGIRGALVLDRVDQRDLVAARARDRPELVEGRDRGAGDLAEALLELVGGD